MAGSGVEITIGTAAEGGGGEDAARLWISPRGDRRLQVEAWEVLVRAVTCRANGLIIRRRHGEECGMHHLSPREDRGLPGGGWRYRREALEAG